MKMKSLALKLFFVICAFLIFIYVYVKASNWEKDSIYKNVETGGNCAKSSPSSTYKVCKTLPYAEIKCGDANTNISALEKHYVVPNVAIFVWFAYERTFQYYNYLALRSVASVQHPAKIRFYYSEGLPIGKHWERAEREIRCLETIKIEEPTHVLGVKMPDVIRRTNLARFNILIETGGIYLDGDVITLKSLDPLRMYSYTMGRAQEDRLCVCSMLARKGSLFLRDFMKEFPQHFDYNSYTYFTDRYIKKFIEQSKIKVHIEESSMSRPNPYMSEDKILGSTLEHIDISGNYLLHLHPDRFLDVIGPSFLKWEDDDIRTLDGVYGDAGRIALFGSSDLIFKPGEETFEMMPKRQMVQFEPIIQRHAYIDDVGE